MERALPTINIEGTEFIVDVLKDELREKANLQNVISINDMIRAGNGQGYTFLFDHITKGIPSKDKVFAFDYMEALPKATIPELVNLDPVGMAEKYNLSVEDIKGKTDFELLIVPGSPLDLRWNKGLLPTLNIAGHTFYIDVQMDKLRPKDDFKSKGISLAEIKEYYDYDRKSYVIPYNPATRECQPHDVSALTELPQDLIMVQFPGLSKLDPVGLVKSLKASFGEFNLLDFTQMHYEARTLPWEETDVPAHIKRNVAAQLRPKEEYAVSDDREDLTLRLPTDTTRTLPTINLYGTDFIVDVNRLELREKANQQNVISFWDMRELPESGYEFPYNRNNKNFPSKDEWDYDLVVIPDFVELDPIGMAKKHGIPENKIRDMADFDLMVNQAVIDKLERQQMLPTIDIAGHTFYVDLARDKLRPKDDIWSRGIIFSELEYYYSPKDETYTFPYNQKAHTFQEVSLNNKEIPENVIVVQIPHENLLDPIWATRRSGYDLSTGLKQRGPQLHFESKVIPWDQTRFAETIKKNNIRQIKTEQNRSFFLTPKKGKATNKRKGRKM